MGSTVSATELAVYHSKGSDGVLDVKWGQKAIVALRVEGIVKYLARKRVVSGISYPIAPFVS